MVSIWALVAALEARYGAPKLNNENNPIDEFVLIVLSARTREEVYLPVFSTLRNRFPDWNGLTRDMTSILEEIIRPVGLATKKSGAILTAFDILRSDYGTVCFDHLQALSDELLESFLLELPGIDRKTARCIMLFSFGRQVLPVDTHVFRVSSRIGLTNKKRADLAHYDLDLAIPPEYRYTYHVTCITHGRLVCRSNRPVCPTCCIAQYCLAKHKGEETR